MRNSCVANSEFRSGTGSASATIVAHASPERPVRLSLFRPLAVNVGFRYARSRHNFLSFVSVMALAGLALSVGVLLYVQAVVHGFDRELQQRVLGVVPHFTLFGRGPIADAEAVRQRVLRVPGVRSATPVVVGAALMAAGSRIVGVELKGVRPAEYDAVIGGFVEDGRLSDLRPGRFDVLLGHGAMEELGIAPGDDVTVVLPDGGVTPFGVFPRRKTLTVAGRVRTGSQVDDRAAYLHADDAGRLFRLEGAFHGVEARIDDALRAREAGELAWRVAGHDRLVLATWFRTHGPLYRTIQVTKGMMFLIFSLLVGVAAFNLVSSLVMIVHERRSDIAILRTIGGRSGLIVVAFVVLGALISSLGVALGLVLGWVLAALTEDGYAWLEAAAGMELMGEYFVRHLPVEFAVADVVRVAATALGLGVLATLFPAWRASRVHPAEVLRHE